MKKLITYVNLYKEPTPEALNLYESKKEFNLKFITGGNHIDFKDALKDGYPDVNRLINEMTSLITAYDLDEDTDYVGFAHYRMFFDKLPELDGSVDIYTDLPFPMVFGRYTGDGQIERFFGDIKSGFCYCHKQKYWDMFEKYFRSKTWFFDKNTSAFDEWASQKYLTSPCNMFIMKKKLFREYIEFYKCHIKNFIDCYRIEDFNGDKYQERQLAFISERMFSLWVYLRKDKCSIKEIKATKHNEVGGSPV